jgi:hypothetical protein
MTVTRSRIRTACVVIALSVATLVIIKFVDLVPAYIRMSNSYEFKIPDVQPDGLSVESRSSLQKSPETRWAVVAVFDDTGNRDRIYDNLSWLWPHIAYSMEISFETFELPIIQQAFEELLDDVNNTKVYDIPWDNNTIRIYRDRDSIVMLVSWTFMI